MSVHDAVVRVQEPSNLNSVTEVSRCAGREVVIVFFKNSEMTVTATREVITK